MTGAKTMRRIVLPQAMRVIVPPTGNEVINMLKTTSLVAVIGAQDLFTEAQLFGSKNFRPPWRCSSSPPSGTSSLTTRAQRRPVAASSAATPAEPRQGTTRRSGLGSAAVPPTCVRDARPPKEPTDDDHDGQGRGRPQVLRPRRGAQGHRPGGRPGEVFCLIGPSGSGKSTFLRCINHLERSTPAGCRSTASWSATGRRATSSTSCTSARSPPSAATSAWSSSASTSSRT